MGDDSVGVRRDPIAEARRQWSAHGWGDAAAGMTAATSIVRINQLLMGAIEDVLRPFGLSFARYEVLRLLAFTRTGGLPMGKLGALLQVHPASVTNAVGRLETAGLVRRSLNPRDGRSTIATILPAGRELIEPATVALNGLFSSIGGEADLQPLISAIDALRRRFEPDGTSWAAAEEPTGPT